MQVLEGIDKHISSSFWNQYPAVLTHQRKLGGARLIGFQGNALLHKLSRMRSDFAHYSDPTHGVSRLSDGEKAVFGKDFLIAVAELCRSELVQAVVHLQSLAQVKGLDPRLEPNQSTDAPDGTP